MLSFIFGLITGSIMSLLILMFFLGRGELNQQKERNKWGGTLIFTSYYANHKSYKDFMRVAISRTSPSRSYDVKWLMLAPRIKLLNMYKKGELSEETYTQEYLSQLQKLYDSGKLSKLVDLLLEEPKVVLLCYESKGKFCHRHILASFLNEHYDLNIQEL